MTARTLESMRVPFFIVVEAHEYAEYATVIEPRKILILDNSSLITTRLTILGSQKVKARERHETFAGRTP